MADYSFLKRFLDVTKANMFFARGLMIVEGDAENILMPSLARLLKRDLTENGVSIVNVGGIGLRRFSRIYQRKEPVMSGVIGVPVACVTDLDVMPDCAPEIVGKVEPGNAWPEKAKRHWRVKSDYQGNGLDVRRKEIRDKASGQKVETFVAVEWTLEYDLAYAGLAQDVWIAIHLARADEKIHVGAVTVASVEAEAKASFASLADGLSKDVLAANVYARFTTGSAVSKATVAQYLAAGLERRQEEEELSPEAWRGLIPQYLCRAIDHVTAEAIPEKDSDESSEEDAGLNEEAAGA
jgi:putative ATP-dependent endonuclease of OLD family